MTQVWQIGHSQDGWSVDLIDAPQWTFAAETMLDRIDTALGHRLCGNGWPDWMWEVPVGKPHRDEDDWLTNSVPSLLSHGFNSAWSWLIDQQTVTATIPIPDTIGRKLAPDLAFLYEPDDTPEADRVIHNSAETTIRGSHTAEDCPACRQAQTQP